VNRQAEERRKRAFEVLQEGKDGDPVDAARRAIGIDPTYSVAWTVLGTALAEQQNWAESENALRTAIRLGPSRPLPYLQLADVLRSQEKDPATKHWARVLGWRACAAAAKVPDGIAETFSDVSKLEAIDFRDPGVYGALANELESKPPEGVASGITDEFLPYDLLLELCIEAREEVTPALLAEIRATPACVQVFLAALRDAAWRSDQLADEAVGLTAAVLGETGGPEVAPELLELCGAQSEVARDHANWAVWRLGQRLPRETLAAFVDATPASAVPIRCALAEQLAFLPEDVDAEAALRGLLAGDMGHPDAPYLVLVVSDALARRGHRSASRAAYKDGLKLLDAEGRRWAEDKVGKREFAPYLLHADITGHSLEEICFDRLMMDDEEDDEDDDVESPPVERLSRNDPCWCGSGKKYKKCHLASDEQAPPPDDHSRLFLDVIRGTHQWLTLADQDAAREMYFGRYERDDMKEEDAPAFFEWLIRDFRSRSSGKTGVEDFLRRRGHELTRRERHILEAWRDSRYGLYEVQRVEPDKGIELKDHFTGERFFVHDVTSSRELVKWDMTLGRLDSIEGRWEFAGNGMLVPRPRLEQILEFVEQQRGTLSPYEFVKANAHRMRREVIGFAEASMPALQNTDGDPLEFCASSYEVVDEEALLAGLRSVGGLKEDKPGREFAWTGKAGLGDSTSLGRIALDGGKLKLECNSRQRLARGKKLIEDAAGKSARYLRDDFESMASALARTKNQPASEEPDIDPAVKREILEKVMQQHYATWPDHPLPALNGQTPRAAMATAEGHRKVLDLLRSFENTAERERKAGHPAFDFSVLRRDLGLPPE
jgi:hypothetical protein